MFFGGAEGSRVLFGGRWVSEMNQNHDKHENARFREPSRATRSELWRDTAATLSHLWFVDAWEQHRPSLSHFFVPVETKQEWERVSAYKTQGPASCPEVLKPFCFQSCCRFRVAPVKKKKKQQYNESIFALVIGTQKGGRNRWEWGMTQKEFPLIMSSVWATPGQILGTLPWELLWGPKTPVGGRFLLDSIYFAEDSMAYAVLIKSRTLQVEWFRIRANSRWIACLSWSCSDTYKYSLYLSEKCTIQLQRPESLRCCFAPPGRNVQDRS